MPTLDFEKVRLQLDEFLGGLLRAGRFQLKYRIETGRGDGPEIVVNLDGQDADLLLARGGEMLAALEHLAAKYLHLSVEQQGLLSLDCNDYKTLHAEELRLMAHTAAERVAQSSSPFSLNPMNSHDRRIVHLSLRDHPSVRTESEGAGPGRRVVIYPK